MVKDTSFVEACLRMALIAGSNRPPDRARWNDSSQRRRIPIHIHPLHLENRNTVVLEADWTASIGSVGDGYDCQSVSAGFPARIVVLAGTADPAYDWLRTVPLR
jgi:hypothetical protein